MLTIDRDDLSGASTQALLALHLKGMHENSPPGAVFALDWLGLKAPGVTVWTARRDGEMLGMAAPTDRANSSPCGRGPTRCGRESPRPCSNA